MRRWCRTRRVGARLREPRLEPLVVLTTLALDAKPMKGVAPSRCVGFGDTPCVPAGAGMVDADHRDAVHRARRHAKLAAGARRADHRVHLFGGTDDAVDRTRLDAQRAANALALVDGGLQTRAFASASAVQWFDGATRQLGKSRDAFGASGRAAVDLGCGFHDGLGIAAAIGIAAALALGLRQGGVQRADARRRRGLVSVRSGAAHPLQA